MSIHTSAYSPEEERANVLTHAVGSLLALVGGTAMIIASLTAGGDGWQLASAIVFSLSMLALYAASTAYHSARHPARRAWLKVLDHCAILILIAGTYTPFTLTVLRGRTGWTLFIAVWSIAAVGIVYKLFFTGRLRLLSTLTYIAMGWLVVLYAKPVLAALSTWQFGWLLAGGLCYTLGTAFYLNRRMTYSHALWHLACIAGTGCHFIAVWTLVVPAG
ncbi:PAQR family membrane homeostasis protein TrhA [Luteimonas sp. e5]